MQHIAIGVAGKEASPIGKFRFCGGRSGEWYSPETMSGGNSRQRRRSARAGKEMAGQPAMFVADHSATIPKPLHYRLLDFVEHPLFLASVGIMGGLIGMLFYTPVLLICGICIMLAFQQGQGCGRSATTRSLSGVCSCASY